MELQSDLGKRILLLRRRVRLLLVERYALFGGGVGLVAASIMVLMSPKYTGLLDNRLWAATVVTAVLAGCAIGLLYRLDDLAVALAADKRTGLRERVSTAVAFQAASGNGEIEQAVVSDANEHISRLTPSQVFRHEYGRPHHVFGVAALIFLITLFLPQMLALRSPTRRAEVRVMQDEGRKMVSVAKEIRKRSNPKEAELRRLAARLDKLGKQMQTGRMEKKQAMLKIQRLSKQVKAEQDRLARMNSQTKSMAQAQSEMRKSSSALSKSMAAKLAKAKNIPMDKAMKMLPSDKRLSELANKPGPLTSAEQAELQKALEKYADPNSGVPIPAELGQALAKLAENKDFQKASEIMQKLAQKLGSGKMSKMDKEALEKQLQNLSEALKNTDLDKLAQQMRENAEKLAKMSPEELEKLIKQAEEMQKMAMSLEKAGGT